MSRKLSACALVLCGAPVLAHDLYLMPERFRLEPSGSAMLYIHNGDEFPQSGGAPVLERLRDVQRIDAKGRFPLDAVQNEAQRGRTTFGVVPGAFVLTARTVPNFLSLPADKFEDYLRHEHLDQIIAWRKANGEAAAPSRELYSKYAKTIVHGGGNGASDFVTRPVGLTVEIVPEIDPARLAAGDSLPVRVLYESKPLPQLAVESMCAVDGKLVVEKWVTTDTAGRARLPVQAGAVCKLHAIHMVRRTERKDADWESHWASLTFEVPSKNLQPETR
jgi:hypothetical protein